MGPSQSVFFLFVSAVLQVALGRATDAFKNLGISGGHRVRITDAPYMAGLFDDFSQMCGGSIIHEKFILTSAYCATTGNPIEKVHIGSNHVELRGTFIDVEAKFCHENYQENVFDNDICLLKLRSPVKFSKRIAKVDLPKANIDVAAGTLVNITGWGNKAGTGDHYPMVLQQATIAIMSKAACVAVNSIMTDNSFCAGSTRRDACDGDVGGPLTENNVQYGVMSYGTTAKCGEPPSFYTKVSKYITWINSTIRKNL